MTAQDKAEILVDEMYNVDFYDDYGSNCMQYKHAKLCALRAVDEVLIIITSIYGTGHWQKFYEDVKTEIEKL